MKEDFSAYPDVRKFLQYLAVEKNTSALTVKNYGADIAVFIEFLKTRYSGGFNWNDISVPDIRSYLAEMNGKKYARTTIARRISALRSFYKYLQRESRVKQNPFVKVRTPKLEKHLPVFLEELEINELSCWSCRIKRTSLACATRRCWSFYTQPAAAFRSLWG